MFFLCRENVVSGCAAADKKGMGKATAGGSCYVLSNRVYSEIHPALSRRRFDHTDVLMVFFCFHEPDTYI